MNRSLLVVIVAVAGGCSHRSPSPSQSQPSDGGTPEIASCTGKSTVPADDSWTIESGGLMRTVVVHLPPSYDPTKPMPLVLNFHGYSSNAFQQSLLTGMSRKADDAGFIVLYPEGTGSKQSFNGGACCGDAAMTNVDDVGFTRELLDTAVERLCVDQHRVFATGMSNGGFMSHRLGCELSNRIAAVAPVAGVLATDPCTPSRPLPVLYFHGTADQVVPYDGVAMNHWPSAPDSFNKWATLDGCTGTATETFRMSDAHCASYGSCGGGAVVTFCTIDKGGHTWPGGLDTSSLGYGYTTQNISATDTMWTFFQAHPLP
jgi:polyhydroxybutyrate depolymerase